MPAHYSKEKSKFGSGSGTIICWPVELVSTDPNNANNVKNLPAGYLKCDGTKYQAEDYPVLAEIIGTGTGCKFRRLDSEGADIDQLDTDEFVVPDLGSKFLKPTTGGAAGTYVNILTENAQGNEVRRSGMGIESTAAVGITTGNTTVINVSYVGNFVVPSQEIALKGKPAWTKGTGNSGFTDNEAVDSLALHSHMHFSTTNRLRIKSPQEVSSGEAKNQGIGWRTTATTVPIDNWLDNTRYTSSQPPGSNQMPCWAIASGDAAGNYEKVDDDGVAEVVYANLCYDQQGNTGLSNFRYQCLLTTATSFKIADVDFALAPAFRSHIKFIFCIPSGDGNMDPTGNIPATYDQNYAPKSKDGNGVEKSLVDVLPLNSNTSGATSLSYPQVNNVMSETDELSQPDGDPTIHNHKILLTQNPHTYKIKTSALLLSPDNLNTTLTLQIDQVASLDQVTGPYIIMEYLIKY